MKSLILKDLYNIIHNSKSMLFILLFFAVVFLPSSGIQGYIYTCAILCSMMIVTTLSFDERSDWMSYALVMPVSRRDLAAGKYIVLFLFPPSGSCSALSSELSEVLFINPWGCYRKTFPKYRFPWQPLRLWHFPPSLAAYPFLSR